MKSFLKINIFVMVLLVLFSACEKKENIIVKDAIKSSIASTNASCPYPTKPNSFIYIGNSIKAIALDSTCPIA